MISEPFSLKRLMSENIQNIEAYKTFELQSLNIQNTFQIKNIYLQNLLSLPYGIS